MASSLVHFSFSFLSPPPSLPQLPLFHSPFSLSCPSLPGGISRSTEDQKSISPRGGGEEGGGGGGGGVMAIGGSSTLRPGSGQLNVSKTHKRSRSEGAIHSVVTERYV